MSASQDDRAFRLEDMNAAFARAAETARRLAAAAGQSVIYCANGQIVEEFPCDERTTPAPIQDAG